MTPSIHLAVLAVLAGLLTSLRAQPAEPSTAPSRATGVVVVQGSQPSSLPTRIPTTIEGVTGTQITQTINATGSEDALKYLPGLLVRKRTIGDHNHAVLSTRASGAGNSARSLVYADGVLLSNLLGNGAAFTPRWAPVTPEEMDRVDVLYGPFSAAYPGNAAGAVVGFMTRMPKQFEARAKLACTTQPNALYGQQATYNAWQTSASLGDRASALRWFVNANRSNSQGQPLVFGNDLASAGTGLKGGETLATGGVDDLNPRNQPWTLIGSSTGYTTQQDHLKAKLAWDITPQLRANLLLGWWHNSAHGDTASWLRDGAGNTVDNRSGGDINQAVNIGGKRHTLAASDFSKTRDTLQHGMQAVSLNSRTQGQFDSTLAANRPTPAPPTRAIARPPASCAACATPGAPPPPGHPRRRCHMRWMTTGCSKPAPAAPCVSPQSVGCTRAASTPWARPSTTTPTCGQSAARPVS